MQYPAYNNLASSFPPHYDGSGNTFNDPRTYGWNLGHFTPLLGMGSSLANSMGYGNISKFLGGAHQFMGTLPSIAPQNWGAPVNTNQPLNPLMPGNATFPQAGWGNTSGSGWLGKLLGGNYNAPTSYNGWPLQNMGMPSFGTQPFFPPGMPSGNTPGYGLF